MIRRVYALSLTTLHGLPHSRGGFLALLCVLLVSILSCVITGDLRFLALIPVGLGILLTIVDFRAVFFLLWACIPISTELEFEGGLALDFPAETLMILLTGVTIIWCIHKMRSLSMALLFHPITLLIALHLGWIMLTTICSSNPVLSIKFLLAKIWYVVPFYVLSYHVLRRESDIRKWFFWILVPLFLTMSIVLIRHGATGFAFDTINLVLKPFYRNHVDYALILGVFLPIAFVMRDRWLPKFWGIALCGFFLVAIYFTYTRAAYLGILIALGGVLLTRWKLVKYALVIAVVGVLFFVLTLSRDNRYIDFAPNYYKTISHHSLDNLLEATYRLEDVSTMERFYRWIAAFYMVQEKPLVGFGPNNFVSFYKPYTDQHFVTYVSDNPEQSGVHNYFLMTSVEQGLPGLIIFLALLFVCLLRAEWLYHQLLPGFYRKLLCGVIGSLFFILFALLLNDMIETDKVGSFFFMNLALIVIIERNARIENAFKTIQSTTTL